MPQILCPVCGAKNLSSASTCSNCAGFLLPAQYTPSSLSGTNLSPWIVTNRSTHQADPVIVVKRHLARDFLMGMITFILYAPSYLEYYKLLGIYATILLFVSIAIMPLAFFPLLTGWKFEFYQTYFSKVSVRKTQQVPYSEIRSVQKKFSALRIDLKQEETKSFLARGRRLVVPGNPRLSSGPDLLTWLQMRIPSSNRT